MGFNERSPFQFRILAITIRKRPNTVENQFNLQAGEICLWEHGHKGREMGSGVALLASVEYLVLHHVS